MAATFTRRQQQNSSEVWKYSTDRRSNVVLSYNGIRWYSEKVGRTDDDAASPNLNLRHPRYFKSTTPPRGGLYCYVQHIFTIILYFSRPAAGLLSYTRLRGTQKARVHTTAQMQVPTEVRGTCSGASKSRILASNYGQSFRRARAKQDNRNPTVFKLVV